MSPRRRCKSLSRNSEGSCGEGFLGWPRRRYRSIPGAGCDGRANEGHWQKTRNPNEASRREVPTAANLPALSPENAPRKLSEFELVMEPSPTPHPDACTQLFRSSWSL